MFSRTPPPAPNNLFVVKMAPVTSWAGSGVSEEPRGPRRAAVDFGGSRRAACPNVPARPRVSGAACPATACVFVTVSPTLGGGREGGTAAAAALCGQRKKTREWGREQAKFKIVIG